MKLLGYRKDIYELNKISDIFIFPSKQEGLPVALMEALACGLPVICSDIRGNRDLIGEKKYCVNIYNIEVLQKEIKELINDKEVRIRIGRDNQKIVEKYDLKNVEKIMREILKRGSNNE